MNDFVEMYIKSKKYIRKTKKSILFVSNYFKLGSFITIKVNRTLNRKINTVIYIYSLIY